MDLSCKFLFLWLVKKKKKIQDIILGDNFLSLLNTD